MARVPKEVAALLEEPRAERVIAIVGASNTVRKYGSIIFRDLRAKGFDVVPINPKEREVDGLACHASIDDAPARIDIIDFVVPPDVSLAVVESLDPAKHRVLWFQPGSFDERVLKASERFEHVVAGPCIMVEAR